MGRKDARHLFTVPLLRGDVHLPRPRRRDTRSAPNSAGSSRASASGTPAAAGPFGVSAAHADAEGECEFMIPSLAEFPRGVWIVFAADEKEVLGYAGDSVSACAVAEATGHREYVICRRPLRDSGYTVMVKFSGFGAS
jgi:hypothetical protein